MIYSASAVAEKGCVFSPEHEGKSISCYDAPHHIEFVIVDSASQVETLAIEVQPVGVEESELHWRLTFTTLLRESGARVEPAAEAFPAKMEQVASLLGHYCRTGCALDR